MQPFLSSHAAPSTFAGEEQTPLTGSHTPASWHWSNGAHARGFPPLQMPVTHVSICVQALPSLHTAPSGLAGLEQVPVAGSHVPPLWHWSEAEHVTGFAPTHVPAWQVSDWVHALPSLHAGPVSNAHVPFDGAPAAVEQASQAPELHAELQQTPSAQKPVTHSPDCIQAEPVDMSMNSSLVVDALVVLKPPTINTAPLFSSVAV